MRICSGNGLLARYALLVLLTCLCFCHGIYEYQAGERDWYRAHIGKVFAASFPASTPGRVVVATEASVIASLRLESGSIEWRNVLPEGETLEGFEARADLLITASSDASQHSALVRCWSLAAGRLLWESAASASAISVSSSASHVRTEASRRLLEESQSRSHQVSAHLTSFGPSGNSFEFVVSLGVDTVDLRRVQTGESIWSFRLSEPNTTLLGLAIDEERSEAHLISLPTSNSLLFTALDTNGEVIDTKIHQLDFELVSREMLVLKNGIVVAVQHQQHGAVLHYFSKNQATTKSISSVLPNLSMRSSVRLSIPPFETNGNIDLTGAFIVRSSSSSALIISEVGDDGSISVRSSALPPLSSAVSAFVVSDSGEFHLSASHNEKDGTLSTSVLDSAGTSISSHRFHLSSPVIRSFTSSTTAQQHFLFVGLDASLSYVSVADAKPAWSRPEALAHPIQVEIVDELFDDFVDMNSTASHEFPSFLPRLFRQASELGHKLTSLLDFSSLPSSTAPLLSMGYPPPIALTVYLLSWSSFDDLWQIISAHRPPPFDSRSFGVHKRVLVLTRSGSLFALCSRSGSVLWSVETVPSTKRHAAPESLYSFEFWMTRSEDSDLEAMEATVLARPRNPSKQTGAFFVRVNVDTGVELQRHTLPFEVVHAHAAPCAEKLHTKQLYIVDSEEKLHHITGKEVECKPSVESQFFTLMPSAGYIEAFRIDRGKATLLWRFAISAPNELVSDFSLSKPETTFSLFEQGMAKFVERSLLVVSTVVRDVDESSVVVYILSADSGEVVHHVTHVDADGPVPVVVSENLVVYSFFNTLHTRYELVAIEVYHDTSSSVKILQQAYVFPSAIVSLGVSQTLLGVCAKQVLVALESGEVLAVERSLLNPRRPAGTPTPEEKALGLVPYSPLIAINPLDIISYYRQLHRIDSIVTAATLLESTSLVLCSGLDMFFSPVTPSRPFDTLNEDFNLPFLMATISAVAIGIFIARSLSRSKALAINWQ